MINFNLNYDPNNVKKDKILVGEGRYEVYVGKAEAVKFTTGNVGIKITFIIRNDVDQRYKNCRLWYNLTYNVNDVEKSNERFAKFLSYCQVSSERHFSSLDEYAQEILHKHLVLGVKHEEYQGEKQAKVKWVNKSNLPAPVITLKEEEEGYYLDDEEQELSVTNNPSTPNPPSPPSVFPNISPDDLPF